MQSVIIKVLNNKDIINNCKSLKECIYDLINPYTDKNIKEETERIYSNMKKYTLDNTATVVGAFIQNNLVGFLWGYKINQKTVHINYFFVKKEYRKHGIGKELLLKIKEKIKDVEIIELLVDKENENAIRFYKNNDFYKIQESDGKYKLATKVGI